MRRVLAARCSSYYWWRSAMRPCMHVLWEALHMHVLWEALCMHVLWEARQSAVSLHSAT